MKNNIPATKDAKVHWGKKAKAWDKWADPMQDMAEKFNRPLLDMAQLSTGQHILDLASGVGEPAITAAKISGDNGFCCATDFIAEMLYAINKRLDNNGNINLLLSAADMQNMPFKDASFDRIICRFGVMFADDMKKLVAEMQRLLKPKGRISLMVWGQYEKQVIFKCLGTAIEKTLNIKPDNHHHSIFRFGKIGSLSKYFQQTNFIDLSESQHQFCAKIPIGKKFWHAQLDMTFGHLLKDINDNEKNRLDIAIKDEFMKTAQDGKYIIKSNIIIFTANIA